MAVDSDIECAIVHMTNGNGVVVANIAVLDGVVGSDSVVRVGIFCVVVSVARSSFGRARTNDLCKPFERRRKSSLFATLHKS